MNGLLEAIKCATADREPERAWLSYPDAPGFWWARTANGHTLVGHAIRTPDGAIVVEFTGSTVSYSEGDLYGQYAFSRVDELR